MKLNTRNWKSLPLWDHQVTAITTISNYLTNNRGSREVKASLITMPTGSGKTAVIAVASQILAGAGSCIVLAPRSAIRHQLFVDIKGRQFNRLTGDPNISLPKKVVEAIGPWVQHIRSNEPTVFVSTPNMIHRLEQTDARLFKALKKKCELLIFDEGHYEPAPEWSQLVRTFGAPVVLLTATPYRNDYKYFEVDPDFTFCLTFTEAVEQRYVRNVEFINREQSSTPSHFVSTLLSIVDQKKTATKAEEFRVIVTCESKEHIRQILKELQNKGRTCLGIHDRFEKSERFANEFKAVPDPESNDAEFWVHQYKLLEGIDNPSFRLLSFYGVKERDTRSLVQQIGRIVRNPGREKSQVAWVVDQSNGSHYDRWKGYLHVDSKILAIKKETGTCKHLTVPDSPRFWREYVDLPSIPPYVKGLWREPFDLNNNNLQEDIQLPKIVNFYTSIGEKSLSDISSEIERQFKRGDRSFRQIRISSTVRMYIYICIDNSRFLINRLFPEYELGVLVLKNLGDAVAYFDSSGFFPYNARRPVLGRPLRPKNLKSVFSIQDSPVITNISLRNADVGRILVRSKAFSASSIEDTVPEIDDYAQVCTTASGYSIERNDGSPEKSRLKRHYVGFTRSRISEDSSRLVPLGTYLRWVDEIYEMVTSSGQSVQLFDRYAPDAPAPTNPEAVNLLIDLEEAKSTFVTNDDKGSPIHILDVCVDVVKGRFKLEANQKECSGDVSYSGKTLTYKIKSPDLDSRYVPTNVQYGSSSIVEHLNRHQLFRVVPRSKDVVYVSGHFYKPQFPFGKEFSEERFYPGKALFPIKSLRNIVVEKATPRKGKNSIWSKDSLFGFIDESITKKKMFFGLDNPDILICTDMGTEIADFLVSSPNYVALIHAKASPKWRPFSAQALQEVLSQAQKNLAYLSRFSENKPKNVNNWDNEWTVGGGNGSVTRRIRVGSGSAEDLWATVRTRIQDPSVECGIWVVLGNILSKSQLFTELSKTPTSAEAIQCSFLIQSTIAACFKVGAKFRIYCCE